MSHDFLNNNIRRLVYILFWIFIWQIISTIIGKNFILPSPYSVIITLKELVCALNTWKIALKSSVRILKGFILSLALGALLGALAYKYVIFERFFQPIIFTVRAVPVASFTILVIILVSANYLSTIIAMLIGFPIIYEAMIEGLKNQDIYLEEMAKIFKIPRIKKMVFLTFPQLLSYFSAGAITALGLSWKSGVAAELIAIPKGTIGEQLYSVKINFLTADLFAWTLIIVMLNLFFAILFRKFISLFERWIETY